MALEIDNSLRAYIPKGPSIRAGVITLDDDYPAGGWPVTFADFQFGKSLYTLMLGQASGYVIEYDPTQGTIRAYAPGSVAADGAHDHTGSVSAELDHGHNIYREAGWTHAAASPVFCATVELDATPEGNGVYLKYDSKSGQHYLCANNAVSTEDEKIDFTNGVFLNVVHDADAATGVSVLIDRSDTGDERLEADLTAYNGGKDVFVATCQPGYYVKIRHDDGGGVPALVMDDTGHELNANMGDEGDVGVWAVYRYFVAEDAGGHDHDITAAIDHDHSDDAPFGEVAEHFANLDGVEVIFFASGQ